MIDRIELGPTPAAETCEQVGTPLYDAIKARRECYAYKRQLERLFPNRPQRAEFRVVSNRHDFGTYYEVAVTYDDRDEASINFAFRVEGKIPETWDQTALEELGLAGNGAVAVEINL